MKSIHLVQASCLVNILSAQLTSAALDVTPESQGAEHHSIQREELNLEKKRWGGFSEFASHKPSKLLQLVLDIKHYFGQSGTVVNGPVYDGVKDPDNECDGSNSSGQEIQLGAKHHGTNQSNAKTLLQRKIANSSERQLSDKQPQHGTDPLDQMSPPRFLQQDGENQKERRNKKKKGTSHKSKKNDSSVKGSKKSKTIKKSKTNEKQDTQEQYEKNKVYDNVCLPDPYRTCYQRAFSPENDLQVDEIQRNEYNYGAQLFQRGEEYILSSKSSKNPNVSAMIPYTSPFVDSDEEMVPGTLHLALLQDPMVISCDDIISMEEITLEFLKDNVGNDETFSPVCVFIAESASDSQTVPDLTGEVVETTVFQMDITYVIKKKYKDKIDDIADRRTAAGEDSDYISKLRSDHNRELKTKCSNPKKLNCCSGKAINGKCSSKYCLSCPCKCPKPSQKKKKNNKNSKNKVRKANAINQELVDWKGARNLEPYISNVPEDLYKKSFIDVIREYTNFRPESTHAVIGATDTSDVASCSTNRYIDDTYDIPFSCEEYQEDNCANNEDIIFNPDDEICQTCDLESDSTLECCEHTDCKAGESCMSNTCVCDPNLGDEDYCCTSDDCNNGLACVFNRCYECSIENPGTECCADDDCGDSSLECEGGNCLPKDCSTQNYTCCKDSDCPYSNQTCASLECVKKGNPRFTLSWIGEGNSQCSILFHALLDS